MNATWGFNGLLRDAVAEAKALAVKYSTPVSVWDVDSENPDFEVQGTPRTFTLATSLADARTKGVSVAKVWPDGTLDIYSKRFAQKNGL